MTLLRWRFLRYTFSCIIPLILLFSFSSENRSIQLPTNPLAGGMKSSSGPAPQIPQIPTIPRILVQTHKFASLDDFPSSMRSTMDNLRSANPSWDARYYSNEEARAFIAYHLSELSLLGGRRVLRAYDMLNPSYGPARADLFRYVAIYVNGGVYLDTKSHLRPGLTLDEAFAEEQQLVMLHWDKYRPNTREVGMKEGEFVNWVVAAPPRSLELMAVIKEVVRRIDEQARQVSRARREQRLRAKGRSEPVVL